MAQGARVESIESLKGLKTALWKFAEATEVALGDAEAELHRVLGWLEVEQTTYWQGQIRKRHEAVEKAKEAVRMKRLYKDSAGKPQSAAEEEKQLRLAQQRLEEAQQKNAVVRRSIPRLQKEIQAYKGGVQQLATAVQMELPAAAGRLEGLIGKLEEYVGLAPPVAAGSRAAESGSAAEPEVASMGRGETGAMGAQTEPVAGAAAEEVAFPPIEEPAVALLHVEADSGAPVADPEGGDVVTYRVFTTIQAAQAYASELVKRTGEIRCVIYDDRHRELLIIGAE